MIFVTVGTDKGFGFKRLIEACDQIASEISMPMTMQIAVTKYIPKHATYFPYISMTDYFKCFVQADLIISHCSIGPVVNASRFRKPLIVFPRQYAYGELADEHQLDFARTLEVKKSAHIKVVYETKDLKPAIQTLLERKPGSDFDHKELLSLVTKIKDFVSRTEKKTEYSRWQK